MLVGLEGGYREEEQANGGYLSNAGEEIYRDIKDNIREHDRQNDQRDAQADRKGQALKGIYLIFQMQGRALDMSDPFLFEQDAGGKVPRQEKDKHKAKDRSEEPEYRVKESSRC